MIKGCETQTHDLVQRYLRIIFFVVVVSEAVVIFVIEYYDFWL